MRFFMHTAHANAAADDTLQPLLQVIRAETHSNVNPSTPWRWITKGIAGLDGERIKLQVWYVGRAPHTTKAAVRQWLEAVTRGGIGSSGHGATPRQRQQGGQDGRIRRA